MSSPRTPNTAPSPDPRIEAARVLNEQIAAIDTRISNIAAELPEQAAAEQAAHRNREAAYDSRLERGVEIGQLAVEALTEGADWVHYKAAGLPSNPNQEHTGRQQLHGTIPVARTRRYARDRDRATQGWNGYVRVEDHTFAGWARARAARLGSWIARHSDLSDPLVVTTKHRTIEHHGTEGHYHYGMESPHHEAHAHRERRGDLQRPDAVAVVGAGLVNRYEYTVGHSTEDQYTRHSSQEATQPEELRQVAIERYRNEQENTAEEARDRLYEQGLNIPDAATARSQLHAREQAAERAENQLEAAIARGASASTIEGLREAAFRSRNLVNNLRTASYERPAAGSDNPTTDEILTIDQRLIAEAGGLGGQYYEVAGPRKLGKGLVGNVYQEVANKERWRHGVSTELNDLVLGVDDSRRAERQQELASVEAELQAARALDPSLATFDAAEYRHLAELRREAREAQDRLSAISRSDPDYHYYQIEAANAQTALVNAEGLLFHIPGFDTMPDAVKAPYLAQRRQIADARRDIAELDTRRTELQTMLGMRKLDRRLRPDGNGGETSDFRTLAELAADLNLQLMGTVTMHAAIDAALPRTAIHERRKQILDEIDALRRQQPVQGYGADGLARTYYQTLINNMGWESVSKTDSYVGAKMRGLYQDAARGLGLTTEAEIKSYIADLQAGNPSSQQMIQARSDAAERRIAELQQQTKPLDRRLARHTSNDVGLLDYQQAELGERVIAAGADRDTARELQERDIETEKAAEQARLNAIARAQQLRDERLRAQQNRNVLEQRLNAIPPQFHP